MLQYFTALLYSVETWFSTDWTRIASFFAAQPWLIIVATAGAVLLGLWQGFLPRTAILARKNGKASFTPKLSHYLLKELLGLRKS